MRKGLVIAVPGTGWSCRETLCQACLAVYRAKGYDTVEIDFSAVPFREIGTLEEAAERAGERMLEQLAPYDLDRYEDVVLLSKSLGTLCAGRLEQSLCRPVRQVYLTPVEETLAYVLPSSQVILMAAGAEDRKMDAEALRAFCAARRIPCLILKGVGHSLKTEHDPECDRELIRSVTARLS